MLLTGSLFLVYWACFPIHPRPAAQVQHCTHWARSFHFSHQLRKCTSDLPKSKSYGGIFFLPQMTLAGVKLTQHLPIANISLASGRTLGCPLLPRTCPRPAGNLTGLVLCMSCTCSHGEFMSAVALSCQTNTVSKYPLQHPQFPGSLVFPTFSLQTAEPVRGRPRQGAAPWGVNCQW